MAKLRRKLHACSCMDCQEFPQGKVAQDHRAINRVLVALNEKARRLFAGLLASQRGHGGIVEVATITGLSRTTIHRGMQDLEQVEASSDSPGRVRRPGGGRKRIEKKFLK